MKKIFLSLFIILMISGCGEKTETLSCTSTNRNNGVKNTVKYDIEYQDDEIKHIKITYDYNQTANDNMDGTNADTDGLDENNNTNDNNLTSDDVVDGVVGNAIDETVESITETILDIAGIRNNFQNQFSIYDNIEGFSYTVDTDTDNEYKVIYDIDMDKISDDNLARFNVDRDLSDFKDTYENNGYTCE